jgi:hypothetical protein
MRPSHSRALALAVAGILAAASLPGCGSPASPRFIEETSVFGMLHVGEALTSDNAIVVMHTRPVDRPYDLAEAAVRGAIVLLQADGAITPDTLRMFSPGRYANPAITIAAHTTYHLTIRDGERTITATTTTPAPFTVSQEPVVAPATMPHSAIAESYPIVLDGTDAEQIMLVDTFCLETYQNAFYVNPIGTHDRPKDDKEYGGAQTPPRNTFFYFRLGDLPRVAGGYRLSFYGDMMQFYGAYTLGLFAIDTNYYNFLFREQPESHSGVLGGIGVFGSAARRVWQVKTTR